MTPSNMVMTLAFIAFIIASLCGVICFQIAEAKHRNKNGWFWLGFFFGPIGILAVAMITPVGDRAAAPPAAASTPPSTAAEIQALADLRARGLLTDDEFAAQKAKVLSA